MILPGALKTVGSFEKIIDLIKQAQTAIIIGLDINF
jgi:hypothetical protein